MATKGEGEGRRFGSTAQPDFASLFADLKLPSFADVEPLMRAYQRNMEALSAANKVALEGAQAYARRHMEIVQQSLGELTQTMQALAAPGSPQEKSAAQVERMKQSYERAIGNMRELGELVQRANNEAVQLLSQRFAEAMNDVREMMSRSEHPRTEHKAP
ncbi:MAG: phasin family protein [Acetobacteraceae bacterium]